ncbi:MAG: PLP-dependent transferase, partial [Pseudomonadota bacterium]
MTKAEHSRAAAHDSPEYRDATRVTTLGRHPSEHHGIVNPPVYRASTVLYPSVEAYQSARTHHGVTYGSAGTPTTYDFEETVAALENGHRALALASGKTAVNLTLAALLQTGDHLLMVDTAYGPTRSFCEKTLKRYGVDTTFYDPAIGGEIASMFKPNTRLVFMEAPGSLTFEMQDVPAIAAAAR